jgi:hypothetical protein
MMSRAWCQWHAYAIKATTADWLSFPHRSAMAYDWQCLPNELCAMQLLHCLATRSLCHPQHCLAGTAVDRSRAKVEVHISTSPTHSYIKQ